MIDPILGGFLRILSVSPEPTLKSYVETGVTRLDRKITGNGRTFPDSILHFKAPVLPLLRPLPGA
jgi:hypothetical protein